MYSLLLTTAIDGELCPQVGHVTRSLIAARLSFGHELLKTTEIVAHAYNLKIQSPKARVPKLAYIYDAAGGG